MTYEDEEDDCPEHDGPIEHCRRSPDCTMDECFCGCDGCVGA